MAIMPMKKVEIYGLRRNRKQILEILQSNECIEVANTNLGNEVFGVEDVPVARPQYESAQKKFSSAIAILDGMQPQKHSMFEMFEGTNDISYEKYKEIEEESLDVLKVAQEVLVLDKKRTEIKADIAKIKISIDAIASWEYLDVGMNVTDTEYTSLLLGTLPAEYSEEALSVELAKIVPEASLMEMEIISSSPQQTCLCLICHKKEREAVENALRSIGFSYPTQRIKQSPKARMKHLLERIETASAELKTIESSIMGYLDQVEKFHLCQDYFTMRLTRCDVLETLLQSNKTFALMGYVTSENSENIKNKIESQFDAQVEIIEPDADEEVPVKLKNNGFAAPVEGVVESYGLPLKGEVDPSPVMAFFYYALFGMMFSDLGYGLMMMIACGFVLTKYKNMNKDLKNSIKMFLYCGISTSFWGLMFGSFFGDVIDVVGTTFFDASWATPCLWFNPIDDPMLLLMLSLLFGIIHLFTGLGIKFYALCRKGMVIDAICDVVFWYMLIGGGVVKFMSTQMFADISGLGFMLPSLVGTIGGYIALAGSAGVVLTAGRSSKSYGVKFMKGLYDLYGATSYLSDILSYSRLLALGLATGVIATVFNQIAAMGGNSIAGTLLFVIVFFLGHALNFGLNVLGAYVHSNRLEYVEFFGKFYEGGGKKFSPFKQNTKYFNITEDN